jgi:protein TonB
MAIMTKHPKKFDALKVPAYPGGKTAFMEFIAKNIQYPKEAEEAGIEGSVIVAYEILDTGMVENVRLLKGLGYGCDEEAIRVVSLLKFDKVRNKNVRTRTSTRATIHFNLNRPTITYTITNSAVSEIPANPENSLVIPAKAGTPPPPTEATDGPITYTYTIDF